MSPGKFFKRFKKKPKVFRHGDLLIKEVSSIPNTADDRAFANMDNPYKLFAKTTIIIGLRRRRTLLKIQMKKKKLSRFKPS